MVVLDLDDAVGDPIEEVTVVRDDDERAFEAAEPLFEPRQALHVKEVRRLVHQQNVGRLQQNLRQRRAVAPSAGKLRDRTLRDAHR